MAQLVDHWFKCGNYVSQASGSILLHVILLHIIFLSPKIIHKSEYSGLRWNSGWLDWTITGLWCLFPVDSALFWDEKWSGLPWDSKSEGVLVPFGIDWNKGGRVKSSLRQQHFWQTLGRVCHSFQWELWHMGQNSTAGGKGPKPGSSPLLFS